MRSIAAAELEDLKAWRRENGIHDNTLRKQLILLRGFFSYARKQGWLLTDPFEKGEDTEVKIPFEVDSEVMHVLSLEEQARYFNACKKVPDLFDVATIMIELGPRPAEVMSLQQSHVDLFNRHFTIWDSSAEGKSKSAHRKLKMTPAVFRIFAQRLSKPSLWVFPSTKTSGPRTTLQKAHTRAVTAAGVPCRLYDMRHTFGPPRCQDTRSPAGGWRWTVHFWSTSGP